MKSDLAFLKNLSDRVWDRALGAITTKFRSGNRRTFAAAMPVQVTISDGVSLLYLFHPPGVSQRYTLECAEVSFTAGTAGTHRFSLKRITGEAAAPGGTLITPAPLDPTDAYSSSAIVRTNVTGANAPTSEPNGLLWQSMFLNASPVSGRFVWTAANWLQGKAPVCRPGVSEGYALVANSSGVTTPGIGMAAIYWTEE